MKKLVISLILALALLVGPVSGALALTSQDVTVTATPSYICIVNAPDAWVINDVADAGGKTIEPNTQYYSNPLGDITVPAATVLDTMCRFTITNTSSVNINIVINFPSHTGGDASTNSDDGTNGATTFGAFSYTSYAGFNTFATDKEIAKTTASTALLTTTTPGDNFLWGLTYLSQSGAWTSGIAMESTVVITATVYVP